MKIVALLALVVLSAGPPMAPATTAPQSHPWLASAGHGDDEPPPVDCPMCGGNVEMHRLQMKRLANFRATLLLVMSMTH